ncbi:MAG: Flp family type IVb pilin [Psychromonas sp.]|nr:Flp family type IVb pilin [Psychromonas sp.]
MKNIKSLFAEFIKDESGLTAVEYAIAGSLVAAAVAVAFGNLGTAVTDEVQGMADIINS